MTAPTTPPKAVTRSKVGRRLREAYELISRTQLHAHTKGAQVRMLRRVWDAIEQAEAEALREVNSR